MPRFNLLIALTFIALVQSPINAVSVHTTLAVNCLNVSSEGFSNAGSLITGGILDPNCTTLIGNASKNKILSKNSIVLTKPISISCDTSAGSSLDYPIDLGVIDGCFHHKSSQNTAGCFFNSYGYPNENAQGSNDVYYKFSLTQRMEVAISHCETPFDTYMHLLDSAGTWIQSCDDYGPLCPSNTASILKILLPGTYYVVSEGYGFFNGLITTEISSRSVMYFDGEDDQVEVAAHPALNFAEGPFTMEAVIKTSRTSPGSLQAILSKRNETPYEGFILGLWADGHIWVQLGGAVNLGWNVGPTVFDGKYHHVAITRASNGLVQFYLDGAMYYSTNRTTNTSSEGGLRIGVDNFTYMPFEGIIKNVRLYGEALNSNQLANNLQGNVGYNHLAAYWPLNDTVNSQRIVDLSYNAIFATLGQDTTMEYADPTPLCSVNTNETYGYRKAHSNRAAFYESTYDDTLKLPGINNHIKIGPNPFSDETQIQVIGKPTEEFALEISTLDGVLLNTEVLYGAQTRQIGRNLKSGIYFAKVKGHNVSPASIKIVKIQ